MSAFASAASAPSCTFVSRVSSTASRQRPSHRYRTRARTRATPITTAVVASAREIADYDALGNEWEDARLTPTEIIEHALQTFGGDAAIAFSGAEDVLLIEYASQTKLPFRVFALDTGRLHPQTYRFYNDVEKHFGIRTFPQLPFSQLFNC